ncbi:hypothetical protein TI39_contig313g00010 [Lecanosticta acicola]|uniref:MYB transcription factor n=1 Tax=Lecanosticta acicola TaxID=111012 RepID=A0AAI9ECQ9_9PEZI|nr:hypothetical protein TI39_contig313g00010 [Lecanosticta acicola]
MYTNELLVSNTSPDQKRSLNTNLQQQQHQQHQHPSAYSASPSQLTLPSDLTSTGGIPNPYQQYAYVPSPHDPSGFAFPQQTGYRPQPQLHTQFAAPHPQQHAYQTQHSPINPRKRRASEMGEPSLPGSSGSSASAFTNPTGLVTGGTDLGMDPSSAAGPSQQTLPSPVAKKGRTNTPWTPAEEQRLKTLREAGSSWSEIAKTFPTRTEGSVKKHWYKVLDEDMHYAEFAEDESAALLQAIKDYENNKWKVIGQKVGKPAKACEQFAKEQGWKV